jgi:hypothetical protein
VYDYVSMHHMNWEKYSSWNQNKIGTSSLENVPQLCHISARLSTWDSCLEICFPLFHLKLDVLNVRSQEKALEFTGFRVLIRECVSATGVGLPFERQSESCGLNGIPTTVARSSVGAEALPPPRAPDSSLTPPSFQWSTMM